MDKRVDPMGLTHFDDPNKQDTMQGHQNDTSGEMPTGHWNNKRATKDNEKPRATTGYQYERVEGNIIVPSPLTDLHEVCDGCHHLRLRMT